MTHEAVSRRGGLVVLAAVAALLTLLLPAAALAITATPTVTIVGPGYLTETPPPTAAAPTVGTTWVLLYLDDGGLGADAVRFSNDGGATWGYTAEWSAYQQWYLDEGSDVGLWLDGPRTVTAQFSDDAGETWGPSASATTILDLQGPVVAAPEGYWNSRYAYRVSAHDQIGLSGVQSLWYRVDAGQLTEVTNESPAGTSDPARGLVRADGRERNGAQHRRHRHGLCGQLQRLAHALRQGPWQVERRQQEQHQRPHRAVVRRDRQNGADGEGQGLGPPLAPAAGASPFLGQ